MDIMKYLRNSIISTKKQIQVISLLFAFSAIIGMIFHEALPQEIMEFFKETASVLDGKTYLEISQFIIANNLKVAFLGIITGIAFGIIPILIAIGNGFVIGSIMTKTIMKTNVFIITKLVPHGIFEIPAIILSLSYGLKIGQSLTKKERLKETLKESAIVFLTIILPFIIIAGFIEGALI